MNKRKGKNTFPKKDNYSLICVFIYLYQYEVANIPQTTLTQVHSISYLKLRYTRQSLVLVSIVRILLSL